MQFNKMHALGNDFLITKHPLTSEQVIKLSNRNTGVGFDQALVVETIHLANPINMPAPSHTITQPNTHISCPPAPLSASNSSQCPHITSQTHAEASLEHAYHTQSDCSSAHQQQLLGSSSSKMHSTHTMPHFSNQSEPICANISFTQLHKITVFNANGTKAGFCGNGFRCVANLLAQFKHAHICLQTETGQLVLAQTAPNHCSIRFPQLLKLEKQHFTFGLGYLVDIGNKHLVFMHHPHFDTLLTQALAEFGQDINIFNITKQENNDIWIELYERGAGKTLACGSGACAVAWVVANPHIDPLTTLISTRAVNLNIRMPGGTLQTYLDNGYMWQKSAVELVFSGSTGSI